MDREAAIRILHKNSSSKGELRRVLAWALDVECPVPEKAKSLFSGLRTAFCEEYRKATGLHYAFTAKDAGALKMLETKLRNMQPDQPDDIIIKTLCALLENMPEWYKKNGFSLSVINSKLNEIVAGIKTTKSSAADDYKARILARNNL